MEENDKLNIIFNLEIFKGLSTQEVGELFITLTLICDHQIEEYSINGITFDGHEIYLN